MRDFLLLTSTFQDILRDLGLPWPEKAVIEPPKDPRHGDLATNLALVLTKQAGMPPRALAERLSAALTDKLGKLVSTDIAGPGFLNVTFAPAFWRQVVTIAEEEGERFGSSDTGHGRKIQLEYVSANPTGPLHIGHGRGAAVGDTLARVLRFAGYDVTTEYYINDAGRQMRLLGLSVYLRLREAVGLPVTWPDDYYHGDYIRDIALELLQARPELPELPEQEAEDICFRYAMNSILDGIKADLTRFHVEHQVWFSERSLVDAGKVESTLSELRERGLAYDQDGALWFASSRYGDDKDRVLRKSDGTLSYLTPDIANHVYKMERGYPVMVNLWGADHHSYVTRMQAALTALGYPKGTLSVELIQMVRMVEDGVEVKMSKRTGNAITLRELCEDVGVDAARWFFVSKDITTQMDFDIKQASAKNYDNPVYYAQYAHSRMCSILRNPEIPEFHREESYNRLTNEKELQLLKMISEFPGTVAKAAKTRKPNTIAEYIQSLVKLYHSYYNVVHVNNPEDPELTNQRLGLVLALKTTLRNALDLLGVDAPQSM